MSGLLVHTHVQAHSFNATNEAHDQASSAEDGLPVRTRVVSTGILFPDLSLPYVIGAYVICNFFALLASFI